MMDRNIKSIQTQICLKPYTTLKAGGKAELFAIAKTVDQLAQLAHFANINHKHLTVIGSGSNILPSDEGVSGLVVFNQADSIEINDNGEVIADVGCAFQELFLKTAQAGLKGHEYAVGIPGTLGGALVSNAGAYRSNISEFLVQLEIVQSGHREWVKADWMEFEYRNSKLRCIDPPQAILLRAKFQMPKGNRKAIYDEAREYQRQRIFKQPAPASAGSFFKNVNNSILANKLTNLPENLRKAGVIPAGFLIMCLGLDGYQQEGAMFSIKHANFIVNIGNANATAIRNLAEYGKYQVMKNFGILLEEEVLYLGDWNHYILYN